VKRLYISESESWERRACKVLSYWLKRDWSSEISRSFALVRNLVGALLWGKLVGGKVYGWDGFSSKTVDSCCELFYANRSYYF